MKRSILALIMAGMLLVCSCTSDKTDGEKVQNNSDGTAVSEELKIEEILAGEVVDARNGEKVKVSKLDTSEEADITPWRYCELDLDGDGKNEYLIEYSDFGNTAIIHELENELYAYMIPFSSRQTLKTDGEMMWQGGSDYSGTQRVEFSGSEMETIITLESDFDKDVHYIDGKEVSFEEAMKAWDKFDAKENADWLFVYDILEQ